MDINQTYFQFYDGMTPVLQSITEEMKVMISYVKTARIVTESGAETYEFVEAGQAAAYARTEVLRYQEALQRAANTPVGAPVSREAPVWDSIASPPVFMERGEKRFAAEYQEANRMAMQLYQNQQAISDQVRGMNILPPDMLNDAKMIESRMESLSVRVEQLNSIPVELRTDQTNNELESLREKLFQAMTVQEDLNQAMTRMDIQAANVAYSRLNAIMDVTEREIRDNLSAQEEFNKSAKDGDTLLSKLGEKIKNALSSLLTAENAGKVLALADQMTQSNARLGQMNQQFGEKGNLQQRIYESAQRSRGGYQTTADTVVSMGMQAQGAFSSTDEVIAFTEQLNKTFVIAGTSTEDAEAIMLQLTQSMASGTIEGEALNTVMEQARPIVQNIADYMGVPVEKIGELASQGKITADIMKNSMFAAADRTNEKLNQIPMTFGQVGERIQNQALIAFQPVLEQLSQITGTEEFNTLVDGITLAIQVLASGAVLALDMISQAAAFMQENWGWLGPVIGIVAAAVLAYQIASVAATAAQWLFNASLYACPLTWIVLAILVLIALIYLGVDAWNRFSETSVSATGIIMGTIGLLAARFYNKITFIWNQVAAFINFFANVFHDPVASVQLLFCNLALNVVNYVASMAQAIEDVINKIPGVHVDIVSGLDNFKNKIKALEGEIKSESEWKEVVSARDFLDYSQSFQKGYSLGEKVENRFQDMFQGFENPFEEEGDQDYGPAPGPLEEIAGNTGNTAANTAAMADTMDLMEEELKYMREAAEQEIINRFTLAELKLDINNNNTLRTETDFEDVNRRLGEVTGEILAAAEGGHL